VREPDDTDARAIAASCLRVCGLGEDAIDEARTEAAVIATRV
jgi:hypothetical protein